MNVVYVLVLHDDRILELINPKIIYCMPVFYYY